MLKITRAVAWIVVIGLIVISLVPAPLRPGTGVSHNFEHFGSFLLAGVLWYLAYADRLLLWLGTVVAFAGGIELNENDLYQGDKRSHPLFVIAGLDPAIHLAEKSVFLSGCVEPMIRMSPLADASLCALVHRNRFIMNPNYMNPNYRMGSKTRREAAEIYDTVRLVGRGRLPCDVALAHRHQLGPRVARLGSAPPTKSPVRSS